MLFESEKKKKTCHKYYVSWLIRIIAAVIAILLLSHLARATKTQQIEIKQPGGSYDGNLTLTRTVLDQLFIYVLSGYVYIKDGSVWLSGDANVLGGINVGTESGAAAGDVKMSGDATIGGQNLFIDNAGGFRVVNFYVSNSDDSIHLNKSAGAGHFYIESTPGENVIFESGSTEIGIFTSAGDTLTPGFISTATNELLATDIIRHTVTVGEATAGVFYEAWTDSTAAKIASITTGLFNDAPEFLNDNRADMTAEYDDIEFQVSEGSHAWVADDVITITVLYEK